ncbi:MAG: N-acetylmuramoyl-L-alanine amidase [Alphaproteobacteria bacterium]
MIDAIPAPSNNWQRRLEKPSIIVIHYTDTEHLKDSLALLRSVEKKVSCHIVIDVDGTIYRLVDDDKTAWHAGVSYWRGLYNINHHSLGVELQNGGVRYKKPNGDMVDYPEKQILSLITLLQYWQKKFSIAAHNIIGHSDIAANRKCDPGPKFPWHKLVEKNLAEDMTAHQSILDLPDDLAKKKLCDLGYDPKLPIETLRRAFMLRLGLQN